jgi:hypothetical protein
MGARLMLSAGLIIGIALAPTAAAASGLAPYAPHGTHATASPTPTPAPEVPTGVVSFTLSPVSNGTVRPGSGLAVSAVLQNGTASASAPGTVTLSIGDARLPDRAALTAWLAGDGSGGELKPVGATSFPAVAAGGEQVDGIQLAAEDPAIVGRAPGVYPLSARFASADGEIVSTSAMIVPPDAAAPVAIGVVVPITAGATSAGLLTATELESLTASTGSLTDQLDAVEGTASILAVDPAIPAAIRVLGTSAPVTATDWLARLESLQNSRFALQFGDADVAAQLQSGLETPLVPLSLQAYMEPANFAPPETPTATPTPTPTPTDGADTPTAVYPTLDELLDIGGARAGVMWPATGTATPDVVARLGAIVVDERESLTLVPSSSTRAGAAGESVPGRAQAGDAGLLVYDADVSRALNEASRAADAQGRGAPLTAAAAYLAFAVADAGDEPIMVTVDRGTDRSRVGLRAAVNTAAQAPGVATVTLGGIAARAPVEAEIADAATDEARVDAASSLVADEGDLNRFATVLEDPTLITGPQRAEILQVLGLEWLPTPEAWQEAVGEHRAATVTTLDSVGILPPSAINLFSAGAPIPIWVRNDLPYPAKVVLYATPDDLRLDIAKRTEATAGPESNTRVQVPVEARIGNGEVSVRLQLRSEAMQPIGGPQTVDVNVRADWEGIGIVVLSVLVGGFILLGVIRTVLRVRAGRTQRAQRARQAQTAETTDAAADADPKPTDESTP